MKRTKVYNHQAFAIGRREFVLGATATFLLSSRLASAQMGTSEVPSNSGNAQSEIVFDDNLVVPIPARPSFGKGQDRALVLGGGGEYFAAWMLGFAYGLNGKGVPYEMPDVIIGHR